MEYIHIMVHCPYIGCPRSIGYCFTCEHKKEINNYDLICDYRNAMKKIKELENKSKKEN